MGFFDAAKQQIEAYFWQITGNWALNALFILKQGFKTQILDAKQVQ